MCAEEAHLDGKKAVLGGAQEGAHFSSCPSACGVLCMPCGGRIESCNRHAQISTTHVPSASAGRAQTHARAPDISLFPPVMICTQIPDNIPKPDYYRDGIPRKEMESKQQNIGGWVGGWVGGRAATLMGAGAGRRLAWRLGSGGLSVGLATVQTCMVGNVEHPNIGQQSWLRQDAGLGGA